MKKTNNIIKGLVVGGLALSLVYMTMVPAVAQTCVSPPLQMISWWPGDGNANDIADKNDGTLTGNATFAPGLVGQAFLLDGSSGGFVDLGNAPNLHVSTGDFTVDAWVKFTSLEVNDGPCTGPGCDMSIVDKMNYGAIDVNDDGWRLLKQSDNRFWFCLGGKEGNRCGDPAFTVFSQTVATTNVWYHVAVVKDSAGFSIYVNGILEDSGSPLPDFLDSNSANLVIGSYRSFEGANLNGLVDEVEIYNRALSAAEIQRIYNAGSAGKCKALSGFSSFFIKKLDIDFSLRDGKDSFYIEGGFVPGAASNGINVLEEAVTIEIGGFSAILPAGSFVQDGARNRFIGWTDGVMVKILKRGSEYYFQVHAQQVDLGGKITNLTTLRLLVGDDSGEVNVRMRGTLNFLEGPNRHLP